MDIEKLIEKIKFYFATEYVWRRWMFFYFWRLDNFGSTYEFGGIQFLKLKIIPKKNVITDYILNQHYNTHRIWSAGAYFVLFDGRCDYDRWRQ